MSRTILIPTTLPAPWGRALAILVGGGAMVAAANLMGPDRTEATPAPAMVPVASDAGARAGHLPAFIGSLKGQRYTLDVYIGRKGPLYTVRDASGYEVATRISSEDVFARFPELNVRDLHADVGTGDPGRPDLSR